MGCAREQLCWKCRNAYADRCCWFEDYTPVPGWTAKPTIIKQNNRQEHSFFITKCPNFQRDSNIKKHRGEMSVEEFRVYKKKLYLKNRQRGKHDKTD